MKTSNILSCSLEKLVVRRVTIHRSAYLFSLQIRILVGKVGTSIEGHDVSDLEYLENITVVEELADQVHLDGCSQEVKSLESFELGALSQDELFLLRRQTLEEIAIESALDNDRVSLQSVDDLSNVRENSVRGIAEDKPGLLGIVRKDTFDGVDHIISILCFSKVSAAVNCDRRGERWSWIWIAAVGMISIYIIHTVSRERQI
jgi:hypothetical protein